MVLKKKKNKIKTKNIDNTGIDIHLYKKLIDNSNDMLFIVEPKTSRFIEVNKKTCKKLGYTKSEMLKLHVYDIDLAVKNVRGWKNVLANLMEMKSFLIEGRFLRKNGISFPVDISARYISNDEEYIVAEVRDSTKRKKNEKELRMDEDRLEALLRLSNMSEASLTEIGDYVLDCAVRLTDSDIGFLGFISKDGNSLDIESWTRKTMKGCGLGKKSVHFPLQKAGLWAEAIKTARPVIVNDYSIPNKHKKGYPKGHNALDRFLSVPVMDRGKVRAIVSVANKKDPYTKADVRQLDLLISGMWQIIQRLNVERELNASEEKFKGSFDTSATGMAILDLDGKFVDINKAFCSLIGYKAKELLNMSFKDITHPEDLKKDENNLKQLLKGKIPYYHMEKRYFHKKGNIIWVILGTSLVKDDFGRTKYILGQVQNITDRKKALLELENEKNYAEMFLNVIPSGFFAVDTSRKIIKWNKMAEKITGYKAKEVLGKKCTIFADEPCKDRCGLFGSSSQSSIFSKECKIRTKNGQIKTISKNAVVLKDKNGKVFSGIESFVDITDRILAYETSEKLAAIVDSTDDAVLGKDINGNILSWNKGAEKLYGYKAKEVIGKNVSIIVPKDKQKELRSILTKVSKGDEIPTFRTKRVAKDGNLLDVSLSVSPIRDSLNKIIGASTIGRDVTVQKKAENMLIEYASEMEKSNTKIRETMNIIQEKEQILFETNHSLTIAQGELEATLNQVAAQKEIVEEEKTRLDSIIQQMSEGVIIINSEKKIERINLRAVELLGYERQEDLPDNYQKMLVLRLWNDLEASQKGIVNKEITIERPKPAILSLSMRGIKALSHEFAYVIIARDITYEKKIEKMKSEFVANVAHDVRSPMAPMKDSISLLLDGSLGTLSDQQRKFINILNDNVDRLLRLVNDLLDLSKIEDGKMTISKSSVNMKDLILSAVDSLLPHARKKGINLSAEILSNQNEVICDKDRIMQVVVNLITNAVKFTPENGSIKVTLSSESSDAIKVCVKDTGYGIREEKAYKLFERFAQLPTGQKIKGSGLGLAISKAIIDLHNGYIWVDSKEGEGSTFCFTLPC